MGSAFGFLRCVGGWENTGWGGLGIDYYYVVTFKKYVVRVFEVGVGLILFLRRDVFKTGVVYLNVCDIMFQRIFN